MHGHFAIVWLEYQCPSERKSGVHIHVNYVSLALRERGSGDYMYAYGELCQRNAIISSTSCYKSCEHVGLASFCIGAGPVCHLR